MVVAIVFVLFCLFVCLFHFQGKGRVMRMKGDGLAMGLLSKAIVDRSDFGFNSQLSQVSRNSF